MDIDPYLGIEWPLVLIAQLSNIIWILVDNINWILDDWCTCLSYRLKRNLVLPKYYISNSISYDEYLLDMCHMRCIKSNWDFTMITQVKSSRWEISSCGRNSPSQLPHSTWLSQVIEWLDLYTNICYDLCFDLEYKVHWDI